jgi:hypothetical protein
MNEAEWLTCMLELLRGRASDRKMRLLAVACCRSIWGTLQDERSRAAVETAERFADGRASEQHRSEAEDRAEDKACENEADDLGEPSWAAFWSLAPNAHQAADMSSFNASAERSDRSELIKQAHLIQCIFGSPLRRILVAPDSLPLRLNRVAEMIYEERAFDRLPILADALEDAGCTNADILAHCRGPGPHVRGCWVVDLLLGKE